LVWQVKLVSADNFPSKKEQRILFFHAVLGGVHGSEKRLKKLSKQTAGWPLKTKKRSRRGIVKEVKVKWSY
jgi:hypothetical protein